MEDYHEIYMAHIYREQNGIVNELAQFVHFFMQLVEWETIRSFPSSTQLVMEREHTFNNAI